VVGNEFVNVLSRRVQWHSHRVPSVLQQNVKFSAALDMPNSEPNCGDATNDEAPVRPCSVSFLAILLFLFIDDINLILNYFGAVASLALLEHVMGFLHLFRGESWVDEGWLTILCWHPMD